MSRSSVVRPYSLTQTKNINQKKVQTTFIFSDSRIQLLSYNHDTDG